MIDARTMNKLHSTDAINALAEKDRHDAHIRHFLEGLRFVLTLIGIVVVVVGSCAI